MATRGETVWLGLRSEGSLSYRVYRDDLDTDPIAELTTELNAAEHAIAPLGDALAVAQLVPASVQPGGELRLFIVQPSGDTIHLEAPSSPPFAVDAPAIFTSDDPAAILIAYIDDADALTVIRADCVP